MAVTDRKIEYRQHVSPAPIVADAEGIFEGHIVVWDDVDSYNSTFKKGSFRKTLRERGDKIISLYNHTDAIGKIVEAREDDIGVWVRGKLTMDVVKAQETFALMRDKVITALSFGFATLQDSKDASTGLRTIKEVILYEVSPVLFPANENSQITAVRATDFDTTVTKNRLERDGYLLMDSLHQTLMDLWWENKPVADFDLALESFHAAYLDWVMAVREDMVARKLDQADMLRSAIKDPLIYATRAAIGDSTPEAVAARTSLTVGDIATLRAGNLLPTQARQKLLELSPEVAAAHAHRRATKISDLYSELRAGGFSPAEQTRLNALVPQSSPQLPVTSPAQPLDVGSAQAALDEINLLMRGYSCGNK